MSNFNIVLPRLLSSTNPQQSHPYQRTPCLVFRLTRGCYYVFSIINQLILVLTLLRCFLDAVKLQKSPVIRALQHFFPSIFFSAFAADSIPAKQASISISVPTCRTKKPNKCHFVASDSCRRNATKVFGSRLIHLIPK